MPSRFLYIDKVLSLKDGAVSDDWKCARCNPNSGYNLRSRKRKENSETIPTVAKKAKTPKTATKKGYERGTRLRVPASRRSSTSKLRNNPTSDRPKPRRTGAEAGKRQREKRAKRKQEG